MQLQFLPLLYAGPDERILVSYLPPNPDPRLCLIDRPPSGYKIEHWGPSLAIAEWAKAHNLLYSIPNWDLVRTVNSKIFSFQETPKLPGAKILKNAKEAEAWMKTIPGPKVLKTPFGTAGGGNIFIDGQESLNKAVCRDSDFYVKQLYIWPMIGEPWVERVMDFSTQWKKGKLLGVTVFENEANGTYKGTLAKEVEPWALNEHLTVAKPFVEKLFALGYQDHLGIDAYIYLWEGKKRVHPVVEMNGRKTMSWVAMQTAGKCLYYARAKEGLLPNHLGSVRFSKNAYTRST